MRARSRSTAVVGVRNGCRRCGFSSFAGVNLDANVLLEERAEDGLDVVELWCSRKPGLDNLYHREILRVQAVQQVGSLLGFGEWFA